MGLSRRSEGYLPPLFPTRLRQRGGDTPYTQGKPGMAVYPLGEGGLMHVCESPPGWRQVRFRPLGDMPGLEPNEAPVNAVALLPLRVEALTTFGLELDTMPRLDGLRVRLIPDRLTWSC